MSDIFELCSKLRDTQDEINRLELNMPYSADLAPLMERRLQLETTFLQEFGDTFVKELGEVERYGDSYNYGPRHHPDASAHGAILRLKGLRNHRVSAETIQLELDGIARELSASELSEVARGCGVKPARTKNETLARLSDYLAEKPADGKKTRRRFDVYAKEAQEARIAMEQKLDRLEKCMEMLAEAISKKPEIKAPELPPELISALKALSKKDDRPVKIERDKDGTMTARRVG